MNTKKIVLLILALLIGGMTMFVARGMMSGPSGTTAQVETKTPPTKEIMVAARDVPAGTILQATDVKWQAWPMDEGTTGFLLKDQNKIEDYVGSVVRQGLRTGEPLLPGRIVRAGDKGFMAAALSPGMRAVSISITPVAGVAGFVFPGDFVDIIVTHQVGRKTDMDPTGRKVSETMLKKIRVLALDQKMNDQVTEPKIAQIATLEVTPKQAETLALLSELGTLSMALRSIANDPEEDVHVPPEPQQAAPGMPPVVMEATELATGATKAATPPDAFTWDSDVSQVLPRPSNRKGAVQKIQIIRGKDTSEAVYDLQQQ